MSSIFQAVRVKPKHCISVSANIQELMKDESEKRMGFIMELYFTCCCR